VNVSSTLTSSSSISFFYFLIYSFFLFFSHLIYLNIDSTSHSYKYNIAFILIHFIQHHIHSNISHSTQSHGKSTPHSHYLQESQTSHNHHHKIKVQKMISKFTNWSRGVELISRRRALGSAWPRPRPGRRQAARPPHSQAATPCAYRSEKEREKRELEISLKEKIGSRKKKGRGIQACSWMAFQTPAGLVPGIFLTQYKCLHIYTGWWLRPV
jgi:hypothetical protein